MRWTSYSRGGERGIALRHEGGWLDLGALDPLEVVRDAGLLARRAEGAQPLDLASARLGPPLPRPGKILCVGLNYADHTAESPYEQPPYPTLFPRVSTGLLADGEAILRPTLSVELDFEGELAVIIGREARKVSTEAALDHVAGYSIFQDGSVRDYQFKTPQWTVGKNFDATAPFGPEVVTPDELPAGAKGLRIRTRLNGETVQDANTADLIYPVAELISIISQTMTLEPGDVIATGTPAGIGWARTPKLFMKHGDTVEVEIEGIGVLRNPIRDEAAA